MRRTRVPENGPPLYPRAREQDEIINGWRTEQEEAFSAERPVCLSMEEPTRRVRGADT